MSSDGSPHYARDLPRTSGTDKWTPGLREAKHLVERLLEERDTARFPWLRMPIWRRLLTLDAKENFYRSTYKWTPSFSRLNCAVTRSGAALWPLPSSNRD